MSNKKIKIRKQKNKNGVCHCTNRLEFTCYRSFYDSNRKNVFISGFASVLNIFGNSSICQLNHKADLEALNYDWYTVGQDIFKAMEDFELEHCDKLSSLIK